MCRSSLGRRHQVNARPEAFQRTSHVLVIKSACITDALGCSGDQWMAFEWKLPGMPVRKPSRECPIPLPPCRWSHANVNRHALLLAMNPMRRFSSKLFSASLSKCQSHTPDTVCVLRNGEPGLCGSLLMPLVTSIQRQPQKEGDGMGHLLRSTASLVRIMLRSDNEMMPIVYGVDTVHSDDYNHIGKKYELNSHLGSPAPPNRNLAYQ